MRLDYRIHTRTAHISSLARIRPARSHSALSASLSPCSPSFAYRSTFFLSSTFLLLTLQYTITVHTMYGWRGSSFYDSNSMYLGEIAFCIGRTDGSPIPPPFCMSYTPVPLVFFTWCICRCSSRRVRVPLLQQTVSISWYRVAAVYLDLQGRNEKRICRCSILRATRIFHL